MGSQQLLLIAVGLVLVAVMIAVGLFMFRDQAAATNRDSISNDLVQFSAAAQKYYRRPAVLGGGQGSFGGLTLTRLTSRPSNSNGEYTLAPDPVPGGTNSITITGVGRELGLDNENLVRLVMTVWADSIFMVTSN